MFYLWFLILLAFGPWLSLGATHNRAGEITYQQTGPTQIRIKITTYTKISGMSRHADRTSLEVNWGDGTRETIMRDNFVDIYTDIRRNEYIATHNYPGPNLPGQPYVVSMQDPNRNDGVWNINGGNSVNVEFYLQTEVFLFPPSSLGFNQSPILLEPPIDFGVVGQVFQHTPNGYDPDGDSIAYELITPFSDRGRPVPGFQPVSDINPGPLNQFTFDQRTGLFTWTSPQRAGEYNIAILVKSFRNGQYLGGIVRDIQIEIRNAQNTPPRLEAPDFICVWAGQTIDFEVEASDQDLPAQALTLTGTGGPLLLSSNPATFTDRSGGSPLSSRFVWRTSCEHIQAQPYQLVFKARDTYFSNGLDASLATFKVVQIRVIAPPPQDLQANIQGGNIRLSWQAPYVCEGNPGFFGFSVWRKELCDDFQPDSCETGLSNRGYTRINPSLIRTPNGNRYEFVDNNIGQGNIYSYRVLAEAGTPIFNGNQIINFHSPNSSVSSEEVCLQRARDLPLMTQVDVLSTDLALGQIQVRWSRPDASQLDTVQNAPPYRYALYRSTGQQGQNFGFAPIYTSPIYNSFWEAVDTSFLDSDLNTEGLAYSYRVAFFVGSDTLGFTALASSVRLNIAATDQRNDLSWTANVPWTNTQYIVFEEQPLGSNNFQVLDTVTGNTYRHENLLNGQTYCYRIQALGAYGLSRIAEPLINHSQKACATPLDTIPPCPPIRLMALTGCDDSNQDTPAERLENRLVWQAPPDSCGADAAKFRIYFSAFCDGNYQLLAESSNLSDTVFLHQPSPDNLAGCYYVTALDSLEINGGGNESLPSNIVQTDNCPIYRLPNAFTPNGDGQNDVFRPFLPYRYINRVEFVVVNRWGQTVFQTQDPMINWDGREGRQGELLPDGVYFYTCKVYESRLNGEQIRLLDGYIHLVREGSR